MFQKSARKTHRNRNIPAISSCRKLLKFAAVENYNICMNELEKCNSVVNDKTFRQTAERLVLKCGVRADLKGFARLIDAVIIYGTELITSFCEIYRAIGELRSLKPKSVMREISYSIAQSFGLARRLSDMLGITLSEADLHSGLVISYLGMIFKNGDDGDINSEE